MNESQTKPVAPLSEEAVAKIEARYGATTEGPWGIATGNFITADFRDGDPNTGCIVAEVPCQGQPNAGNDLEFITHAREDIPALCQTVRALQAEKEWLRSTVNSLSTENAARREQLAQAIKERDEVQYDLELARQSLLQMADAVESRS